MSITIGAITIDTGDITGATTFWQAVTGFRVASQEESDVFLANPKGDGPGLHLQTVPEPRTGKNRLHLDLYTGDLDGEIARIQELGATHVQKHDGWVVLADTDGNQFCVVAE